MAKRVLRVVQQSAGAECGLACAAMVLQAHGIQAELQQIRQTHDTSLRGSSLRDLLTLLADYGLSARPMRIEIEKLNNVRLPCILHWSFDHFVLLETARVNDFDIIDPACGRRRISLTEMNEKFTGIAVEAVSPATSVVSLDPNARLRLTDLLPPLRGLAPLFAIILIVTALLNVGALVLPLFVKVAIDRLIGDQPSQLFWAIGGAFMALALLQGANRWVRGLGLVRLRRALSSHMGHFVFDHLIWLNGSVVERRSAGTITSNFRSIFALSDSLGEDVLSALIDSVAAVAVVAILFHFDTLIGAAAFISIVAYAAWTMAGNRGAKMRMGQVLAQESHEGGFFVETINRLQAIRLFQAERWRAASFATIHERLEDVRDDYARWLNGGRSVGDALLQSAWVTVVAIATWRVSTGTMTLGLFSSIIIWLGLATSRARDAVTRLAQLDWLESHVDRLADILLSPSDRAALDAPQLTPPMSMIGCEGLSVRYAAGLPWVLREVTLGVRRGEWVTVIGASGEGKSTLVKTLTGLLVPEHGVLQFDGETVPWHSIARLRRHVGAVMQNDGLFGGSIRDNITFFDETPDVALMEKSAALAELTDDISRMPMKYDSIIGEQGAGLSAGQCQRLMLARALYKKPAFLVLDEFTANIDEVSEARIIDNIRMLNVGVIAIAHRSQVINAADRVYVLNEGRLTASATESRTPLQAAL